MTRVGPALPQFGAGPGPARTIARSATTAEELGDDIARRLEAQAGADEAFVDLAFLAGTVARSLDVAGRLARTAGIE